MSIRTTIGLFIVVAISGACVGSLVMQLGSLNAGVSSARLKAEKRADELLADLAAQREDAALAKLLADGPPGADDLRVGPSRCNLKVREGGAFAECEATTDTGRRWAILLARVQGKWAVEKATLSGAPDPDRS